MARTPKRVTEVVVRPFTSEERADLERLINNERNRPNEPAGGIVREIEGALLQYGKAPAPLLTEKQLRDELRSILVAAKGLSDALGSATCVNQLALAIWPKKSVDVVEKLKDNVDRYLQLIPLRRGAPVTFSHPASALINRIQVVLGRRGMGINATRGSTFERILRIVFNAAGLERVSDPLSFARRGLDQEEMSICALSPPLIRSKTGQ